MGKSFSKENIIRILEETASLMELDGENPFKIKAYHNAARSLESEDVDAAIKEGRLGQIRGIGKGIAENILEFYQTDQIALYEELKQKVPKGLVDFTNLPGIGPKKARLLFYDLGAHSVGELEYACIENRLAGLKGFGPKSQTNILQAIQFYKKNASKYLYPDALSQATQVANTLKSNDDVTHVEIVGPLRRCLETIDEIPILVSTNPDVLKSISSLLNAEKISDDETKVSLSLKNGMRVDVINVPQNEFPHALQFFTGSPAHNQSLEKLAAELGFKINQQGLFRGEERVECVSETDIYRHLGLHFIPPEMREGLGELDWAKSSHVPQLIADKDIRGLFHMHTLYSDGNASVAAMADRARQMGFEYIGISDHSQSAFYANGLKMVEIKKQHREIDELNKMQPDFKIFKGIESDILADGSLDYDEETLESFDFVIASVHSRFKMDSQEMTDRLVKAVSNPHTTMLGHMTGRLLLSREGYALDVKQIFEAAAKHNTVIEINANPYRLDVDWRFLKMAREMGIKFSINPDAHRLEGLEDYKYGVGIARKGGLTKEDVVNTKSVKEIVGCL